MIINSHVLDGRNASGNGHHGNCTHCGLALVTDLGYCSWDGAKCIDRPISEESDIPDNIKSYARFRGYRFDRKKILFTKATFSEKLDELTIDQMAEMIEKLQALPFIE